MLSPRYVDRGPRLRYGLFVGMTGGGDIYVEPRHTGKFSLPCMVEAHNELHHRNVRTLKHREPNIVKNGDHVVVAGPRAGKEEPGGVRYDRARNIWTRAAPLYDGAEPEHVHSFEVKIPKE